MIASFTQTYGDARKELYDLKEFDQPDIHFRKLCDRNFYSFHNCTADTVKYVLQKDWFKQSKFTPVFYPSLPQAISYPESWKRSLEMMKSKGVSKVVFLQDDVFAFGTSEQYDELMNWVRTHEFKMIMMESPASQLGVEDQPLLLDGNSIKIYSCTNELLVSRNPQMWSLDDAPYIADIDYLLETIYDSQYYRYPNIWQAEHYLKSKMDKTCIERNVCSDKLFDRTNIVGQNTWNRGPTMKIMYEKLKDYGFPKQ